MIAQPRKEAAPSGAVTFLFTDVEGSTRRWEADPEVRQAALADHDEVLLEAIEGPGRLVVQAHGGRGVRCVLIAEVKRTASGSGDHTQRPGGVAFSQTAALGGTRMPG